MLALGKGREKKVGGKGKRKRMPVLWGARRREERNAVKTPLPMAMLLERFFIVEYAVCGARP